MIPGRKFSHTMSALAARRLAISTASGFARSSVMLRLFELMPRKEGPSPFCRPFPAHRRGAPHVVAGLRLDLDHLGPEQGKLVGAERPGDVAGEIEDSDAGKGLIHR
jgi:hypothetical protein